MPTNTRLRRLGRIGIASRRYSAHRRCGIGIARIVLLPRLASWLTIDDQERVTA